MTGAAEEKAECPFTEEQLAWLRGNLTVYVSADRNRGSDFVDVGVEIRLGNEEVDSDSDSFSVA